tara:strand:+ start:320 stop:541 length:222 start_codon:yes stop_codon:yes gene_type:complete
MNELLSIVPWQAVAMLLGAGYIGYEISSRRNDETTTETISKTILYLIENGYVRGYTDEDGIEHMLKINDEEPK